MPLGYPREWHRGRTLLLVTWLTAATSYLLLFFGATLTEEGFAPQHLLLALLVTQALLLVAALLSRRSGVPSLVALARTNPRRLFCFSLILQAALLFASTLSMEHWNDEMHNLYQAEVMARLGVSGWLAEYQNISRWLSLHHPPLSALLYGFFYAAVGQTLLWGRLFNVAFALGSLFVAYRLVARLTDRPTAALASLCWPLAPLWLFNGASAILEGPFLLVFLIIAERFVAFLQEPGTRRAVVVGLWLTVGLLARYNVALLCPGMMLLLLLPDRRALLRRPGTWWIFGVPLLLIAPAAGYAAATGLLASQVSQMTWMFLLLRPGGLHYLLEVLAPLWPLHVGAHLVPFALLSLAALWKGKGRNVTLFVLGGVYLALVLLILPNPRYLLPAVPFVSVGGARVLQVLENQRGAVTAVWLGLLAAALTLTVLVIGGARASGYYPYY